MQSTILPDADVLLLDLNMPGKDGLPLGEVKGSGRNDVGLAVRRVRS